MAATVRPTRCSTPRRVSSTSKTSGTDEVWQTGASESPRRTGTLDVVITAVVLIDIVGFVAILAVCGGMLFLANRIEPHWVAKDQRRFLTTAHELDQFGLPMGRRLEVRVHVDPDDNSLLIKRRSMVRGGSGIWLVHAKSPKPPKGREVYILKNVSGTTGSTDVTRMALRFPTRSRMLPRMDELLAATGEGASRRSARPAEESEPRANTVDDQDRSDDESTTPT